MGVSLTRTAGTPTSKKKFTFSFWYKKTTIRDYGASTSDGCFFNSASSNDNRLTFMINQENSPYDQVRIVGRNGGSQILDLRTNAILRDPSAWYHIVAKVDTTQSTNTDRAKLYINGVEQTLDTSSYPNQDVELEIQHTPYVLSYSGSGNYVEGLITHYHYTDGYAYDASTFGETDSTSGIWKPKTSPSVTYGTNGFFLKFENSGAMGTDSSGNSNTFTVSGTLTQNIDTPDNNFCTLNPLDKWTQGSSQITLSKGNTEYSATDGWFNVRGNFFVSSGKWYWEMKKSTSSSIYTFIGAATSEPALNFAYGGAQNGLFAYAAADGIKIGQGTTSTSYGASYATGDIMGIALDMDGGTITFYKNGVSQGQAFSGITGDVAPWCSGYNNKNEYNFGNGYFGTTAVASANADANGHGKMEYAVPTGYYTLNTKNLKEFG